MKIVNEYSKLLLKSLYFNNHNKPNEEADILNEMDLLWNSMNNKEREIANKSIIFEGNEFYNFRKAWKNFHTSNKHKKKQYEYKFFDSQYSYTDERRYMPENMKTAYYMKSDVKFIHHLIYTIGCGKSISYIMKLNRTPQFVYANFPNHSYDILNETFRLLTTRPDKQDDILKNIQIVFGDTFQEKHLNKVREYLKVLFDITEKFSRIE